MPQQSHHPVCWLAGWLAGNIQLLKDAQTDMLLGEPRSAICVQRFDDSLSSAIHTTYRSWLRSSSMHEPRDPPLEVVSYIGVTTDRSIDRSIKFIHYKYIYMIILSSARQQKLQHEAGRHAGMQACRHAPPFKHHRPSLPVQAAVAAAHLTWMDTGSQEEEGDKRQLLCVR